MNKEKKITIITNELNRGGTEIQLLNLIKKIRNSYDITLFSFKTGSMFKDFKKEKINLHIGGENLGIVKFILFLIFNKTNIYHFFLPKSYILGGILTFFSKKKKIMSRRSLNNYHKKYYYTSLFLEKILHKKMNLILTNSDVIKNQLIKYEKVKKTKVKVIENFVSKASINVTKSKNIVRFLYVANFIEYKSHDKLIQMCSRIKVNKKWQLLLIGADRDGLKKKIQMQIKELNLEKKIKIFNETKNLKSFYNSVDFAISTSAEEGSSNFLLESISYGLPIIAFDVGGNKKFFKNNGYLIESYNYESFREKIEQLIKQKDVKYLGKNSLKICLERFDNIKSLEKYMSCYDALLKN